MTRRQRIGTDLVNVVSTRRARLNRGPNLLDRVNVNDRFLGDGNRDAGTETGTRLVFCELLTSHNCPRPGFASQLSATRFRVRVPVSRPRPGFASPRNGPCSAHPSGSPGPGGSAPPSTPPRSAGATGYAIPIPVTGLGPRENPG